MTYSLSRVLLLPIMLIALTVVSSAQKPAEPASPKTPIHQLRIYEIFENNKQAFHERFRDHAARIMKRTAAKSGQMVGEIAESTLVLTDYSPRTSLLK